MIPHDLDAERALLGDLIHLPHRLQDIQGSVLVEDFYAPLHGDIFAALTELHAQGHAPDVVSLRDAVVRRGRDEKTANNAIIDCNSSGGGAWRKYADVVVSLALARRMLGAAEDIKTDIQANPRSAADALDRARALFAALEPPGGEWPQDVHRLDEFVGREIEKTRWLIPHLMGEQHRIIVVAPEGYGKSMLLRQIAVCAAAGIHPLTKQPMRALRTLIVDLENPEDVLITKCRPIVASARMRKGGVDDRAWIWHRPAGINLRTRADRATLETIVANLRPDLVCMGPLYKAYRVLARENDELAAGEVQSALDDLRTRYQFGLVLEHHAPKKQAGVRELTPYGSSLWLRWPEQGIKLRPDPHPERPTSLLVERWRQDRVDAAWPDRLDRGDVWPWEGYWEQGMREAS